MSTRQYICPSCRQKTGVEILYGMPTELAFEMAGRGEIVLGGCCVDLEGPERECTAAAINGVSNARR